MKVLRLQEKAPPLRLSEGRGFMDDDQLKLLLDDYHRVVMERLNDIQFQVRLAMSLAIFIGVVLYFR